MLEILGFEEDIEDVIDIDELQESGANGALSIGELWAGLALSREGRGLSGQAVTWLLLYPVYAVPPSQRWKPITQLFAEPYVVPEEEDREEGENLTQAEWWELLFFIRQLSEEERQHVVDLLQDHLDEEVGSPQKCPQQVCTRTFGRSGGEAEVGQLQGPTAEGSGMF